MCCWKELGPLCMSTALQSKELIICIGFYLIGLFSSGSVFSTHFLKPSALPPSSKVCRQSEWFMQHKVEKAFTPLKTKLFLQSIMSECLRHKTLFCHIYVVLRTVQSVQKWWKVENVVCLSPKYLVRGLTHTGSLLTMAHTGYSGDA